MKYKINCTLLERSVWLNLDLLYFDIETKLQSYNDIIAGCKCILELTTKIYTRQKIIHFFHNVVKQ